MNTLNHQEQSRLLRELRSIKNKGRPRVACPAWYAEGIEQAYLAYQVPEGWKLSKAGIELLNQ